MDHIDPGDMRWTGKPGTLGTGNMVLLGLFLVSDSSAAVKIECGCGVAAWIVGSLVVSGMQEKQQSWVQEIGHY